jgi:hypothetical protein
MVMSIGLDNLKLFGQFLCPALGDLQMSPSVFNINLTLTLMRQLLKEEYWKSGS